MSNVDTPTDIWTIYSKDEVMEQIYSSMGQYGFAVVAMHPVAHYVVQDSEYKYDKESLSSTLELLKKLKNDFKVVKISEIEDQLWLPPISKKELKIYTLPLQGGKEEIGSNTANLALEVRNKTVFLRSLNGTWETPITLFIPAEMASSRPLFCSEGLVLPSMSWFDSSNKMWIVYVDPPRNSMPLSLDILPETNYAFYLILWPIIPLTLLLLVVFLIGTGTGKSKSKNGPGERTATNTQRKDPHSIRLKTYFRKIRRKAKELVMF